MAKAQLLELTQEQRDYLNTICRTRTIQASIMNRARIILLKANGDSVDIIAKKVGLNRNSILLCLKKFREGGIENAIYDTPGRGRNPEITEDEKAWIIDVACHKPTDLGYPAEKWTYVKLTSYIREIAETAKHPRLSTISKTMVIQILDQAGIKPFRIKYYDKGGSKCERKTHNVLVIYKPISIHLVKDGNYIPYEVEKLQIHTVSCEEKPRAELTTTVSLGFPSREGKDANQRDYENVRQGNLSLLTGLDLITGEAIPLVRETYKSVNFIEFLKILNNKYPKGDKIRLVLDNHPAHTAKETRTFLAMIPGRFEFIFTPKHGSWLNIIEGLFIKMINQTLRGLHAQTNEELIERIYRCFDELNVTPKVHHWMDKTDEVEPGKQASVDQVI